MSEDYKPFVATNQVDDWQTTLAVLNNFVSNLTNYWTLFENNLEIALLYNQLARTADDKPLLDFFERGRVFWQGAELTFQRDTPAFGI